MGCGSSTADTTNQQPQKGTAGKGGTQKPAPLTPVPPQTPEKTEDEAASDNIRHTTPTSGSIETSERNQGGNQQGNKQRGTPPAHEKGYKRRIRQNLRNSTAGDDIDLLEKNMDIFQRNKLEDGGDYTDAEDRLDFLHTRKDIRDACMRRHPKVLEDSIQRTEQSPYKAQLQQYLDRARFLLKNQEDQKMFKHKVSPLEQATVSEVRSYHHPPPGCHDVMIAVYMICGYDEKHLTDWPTITGLMGRYGNHSLPREMHEAEGKPVDKDVALTARNYLGTHKREDIREGSNGAAAFYDWACGMVGLHNPDANKGQQGQQQQGPGQQKSNPNTPKSQSEPSKAGGGKDPVKDKKLQKEQENTAKQQQKQTNQQANKTVKDTNKTTKNTQQTNTTKQTTQQGNTVGNKSTKQG